MLITFKNRLDQEKARQNTRSDLLHFTEKCCKNNNFEIERQPTKHASSYICTLDVKN